MMRPGGIPHLEAASRAAGRKSGCTMIFTALVVDSWYSSSAALYAGFAVLCMCTSHDGEEAATINGRS